MAWRAAYISGWITSTLLDMTIADNKSIPGISSNTKLDYTNADSITNLNTNSEYTFGDGKFKMITYTHPSDSAEIRYELYVNGIYVYGNRLRYTGYTDKTYLFAVIDDETLIGAIGQYEHNNRYSWWSEGSAANAAKFNGENNFTYNLYKALGGTRSIETSNGGGATHIAKVTGQLKDLSSNLSDILMVSGGGGGGLLVDDTDYSGKDAGGISGSGDNSADQSTGNAFGQGESGTNVSGGGSGLYGGYKGTSSKSGGAGSGYIGNSLLSNKKMVGYNVPTSSAESTKTESVNEVSASAVSGKPKSGNGFARIKFLRDAWGGEEVPILWAGNSNKMTVQISNNKIVFKLYSGNLLIYSFDAYVGATIIDADNIYVHFLIDSEQELAKPSMIYDNNSVLSYNQEDPTDEEMADIYTWLSAGLS